MIYKLHTIHQDNGFLYSISHSHESTAIRMVKKEEPGAALRKPICFAEVSEALMQPIVGLANFIIAHGIPSLKNGIRRALLVPLPSMDYK